MSEGWMWAVEHHELTRSTNLRPYSEAAASLLMFVLIHFSVAKDEIKDVIRLNTKLAPLEHELELGCCKHPLKVHLFPVGNHLI